MRLLLHCARAYVLAIAIRNGIGSASLLGAAHSAPVRHARLNSAADGTSGWSKELQMPLLQRSRGPAFRRIMSAIDMFATLDVIEGKQGEKRVVISLNGCALF